MPGQAHSIAAGILGVSLAVLRELTGDYRPIAVCSGLCGALQGRWHCRLKGEAVIHVKGVWRAQFRNDDNAYTLLMDLN
eukprot:1491352-Amphidinium_carterae.2